MENYRGFISWMFRGWYRDLTLWGLIMGFIGVTIMIWEGSLMASWILLSVGMTLVFFDLARSFLSFQYSLYRMERDRVTRELERK